MRKHLLVDCGPVAVAATVAAALLLWNNLREECPPLPQHSQLGQFYVTVVTQSSCSKKGTIMPASRTVFWRIVEHSVTGQYDTIAPTPLPALDLAPHNVLDH